MNKLFVMVGIPGSGKSKIAEDIAEKYNAVIVSTDEIRGEIYGDPSIQGDGAKIFGIAYFVMNQELANGHNVIFDATSVTKRARKNILNHVVVKPVEKTAVFVNTDLEICKRRNKERDRNVPDEVLDRMFGKLTKPDVLEGFNNVIEIDNLIFIFSSVLFQIIFIQIIFQVRKDETAKETLMYGTVLWTLWERERVGRFGRMALKHVKYHV